LAYSPPGVPGSNLRPRLPRLTTTDPKWERLGQLCPEDLDLFGSSCCVSVPSLGSSCYDWSCLGSTCWTGSCLISDSLGLGPAGFHRTSPFYEDSSPVQRGSPLLPPSLRIQVSICSFLRCPGFICHLMLGPLRQDAVLRMGQNSPCHSQRPQMYNFPKCECSIDFWS
jgi:hypothetical protein